MSNIIIEGPDATGKSTLARFLSRKLDMPIQESEGAPKTYAEISDRVARYATLSNTIFVRHPLISNPIYDGLRHLDGKNIIGTPKVSLMQGRPIFIYAESAGSTLPRGHIPGPNDTEEHLSQIGRFYDSLCIAYGNWAKHNAHLHYKIGHDMELVADVVDRLRFDPVADLDQFHKKFDIAYYGKPRFLPENLFEFRYKFLEEELNEYSTAHMEEDNVHRQSNTQIATNLDSQLDALVDLIYVALGNAHLQGFSPKFREAWRRVHAANMTKMRANSADDSRRNSLYDVIKPEGFVAPSHIDLVNDHAYATRQSYPIDEEVGLNR